MRFPFFSLSLKSLFNRKVSVALTIVSIAASVMLFTGVEKIREGARAGFEQTISGTDLIVGGRTGQVNLLLYTVFRIGEGTTGISMDSYDYVSSLDGVEWTVPLSLGDSHRGFRVLGTDNAYFEHFRYGRNRSLEFAGGRRFDDDEDVVVGSVVAAQLGYEIGDTIAIAHGLVSTAFAEHDADFTIVGILAPTGTPVDATVHVTLAGLAHAHEDLPGTGGEISTLPLGAAPEENDHEDGHEHEEGHEHEHEYAHEHGEGHGDEEVYDHEDHAGTDQITAMLVGLTSRPLALRLQRQINTYEGEPLMAILPGVTLGQLWGLLGVAESALLAISGFVILIGLLGLLTRILSSLNERRREMAILRSIGARPGHIFALLVFESALTAFIGAIIGLALLYACLWGANALLSGAVDVPAFDAITAQGPSLFDLWVVLAVTGLAAVLGMLPGWQAYRSSLQDGLSIKV